MLIFLFGPDTFRSRQKLNEIIDYYKKKYQKNFDLKSFEVEDLQFKDFLNELQQRSLFIQKKMIVLKNVFSNPLFKENLLKKIENLHFSKNIILLYEEKEIPEKDLLLKTLMKTSKYQEFQLLEGEKLKKWIKKEFKKLDKEIGNSVLEKLIEFVGNDLWWISREIQKLASFKKENQIEIADLELLIKPKIETDIFKTIDAIAAKNKKRALQLIHKHLKKGDNPLYLLSMINFQFRNLLIIKDLIKKNVSYYLFFKKTKLNPFVIKKTYQQVHRFDFKELEKIYQKIFQIDLNIKSGKIDPSVGLDMLIVEI